MRACKICYKLTFRSSSTAVALVIRVAGPLALSLHKEPTGAEQAIARHTLTACIQAIPSQEAPCTKSACADNRQPMDRLTAPPAVSDTGTVWRWRCPFEPS